MKEWKERFFKYLHVIKNASPHTVRNYGLDLEDFYLFSKIGEVHSVDKGVIRGYLASFIVKEPERTILRRLSTLRSFFNYLLKEKVLSQNPLEEIEVPKLHKTIPAPLQRDEIDRLFGQPDIKTYLGFRDRAIMELFYSSGLRLSEVVSMNRTDFNFVEKLLRIKGKGKKERLVPITENAAVWLSRYLNHPERLLDGSLHQAEKNHEAIFLNRWGERLWSALD